MDNSKNHLLVSLIDKESGDISEVLNLIDDPEDYVHLKAVLENRIDGVASSSARHHELLGIVLLELGLTEKAKEHLLRSLELHPEDSYYKYLYLAQLFTGKESLRFHLKAIELMEGIETHSGARGQTTQSKQRVHQIASAYCSLAEIYMTDLCEDEHAELECEKAIQKALEWDANSLEAQLCLANLRICQCRSDEAAEIVSRSLASWYRKTDLNDTSDDEHALEEEKPLMNDLDMPLYSLRLSTAKLCIELELYEEAFNVLETLLAENDEDGEIWYLFGWTCYLTQDIALAEEHLKKASEILKNEDNIDQGILSHIQELLEDLKV